MIREFSVSDLPRVMEIWLDENINAHNFISADYWKSNYDAVSQMMPKAEVFVYDDGKIKGFFGITDGYIAGLFVDSSFQHKGIGRKLIEYAKERNKSLTLKVYEKSVKAYNFYIKNGFTVQNECIDEATGEKEYIMKWK